MSHFLSLPVWTQVEPSVPEVLRQQGTTERLCEGTTATPRLPGVHCGEWAEWLLIVWTASNAVKLWSTGRCAGDMQWCREVTSLTFS